MGGAEPLLKPLPKALSPKRVAYLRAAIVGAVSERVKYLSTRHRFKGKLSVASRLALERYQLPVGPGVHSREDWSPSNGRV